MTETPRSVGPSASSVLNAAAVPNAHLRLHDLVREIPGASLVESDLPSRDVVVTGVRHDSRQIVPGDLFVARSGMHAHGERFIAEAIARGAVAVLVQAGSAAGALGVPRVEASDVPRALAFAAAAVFGHPTFSLDVVGITGTNGEDDYRSPDASMHRRLRWQGRDRRHARRSLRGSRSSVCIYEP